MSKAPPDFTDFIERHREEIRELCRRYAVSGDDVADLVELAGREVLLRLPGTADPEGRFLRALERRCREHFERHEGEHRKRILDLLAEEPPERAGAASAERAGPEQGDGAERACRTQPEDDREEGKR